MDLDVRDVQLILGYQSPTQFYYVHLSAKTDAVHNGIFLVNNADRRRSTNRTRARACSTRRGIVFDSSATSRPARSAFSSTMTRRQRCRRRIGR